MVFTRLDHNIQEEDTSHLIAQMQEDMQLSVIMLKGKTIELDVEARSRSTAENASDDDLRLIGLRVVRAGRQGPERKHHPCATTRSRSGS